MWMSDTCKGGRSKKYTKQTKMEENRQERRGEMIWRVEYLRSNPVSEYSTYSLTEEQRKAHKYD